MKQLSFLFAAAIFLAAGCAQKEKSAANLAQIPLPVRTTAAENFLFERRAEARATFFSESAAIVAARTTGPLESVAVDVGDAVNTGDILFSVDSTELTNRVIIAAEKISVSKAQLAVAEASLAKAQAEAKKFARDAERFARLFAEGRASANESEKSATAAESAAQSVAVAEANVVLARRQISAAEAESAIALRNLSDATCRAPIAGIISKRNCEPGERVTPGTPVVAIAGSGELRASAHLPAAYYESVRVGETKLRLGGLREITVSAKSPVIESPLRTFEVRGFTESGGAFVPGAMMRCEVIFDAHRGLSVPDDAILTRRQGTIVFTEVGGIAKATPVTIGLRNGGRSEITAGISEGARVIIEGQTQLFDGRKVEVK